MHIRPELLDIFQKVMVMICNNFGLAALMNSNLTDSEMYSLLNIIPRLTLRDKTNYRQGLCSITCFEAHATTPLFHLLKGQMDKCIKTVSMAVRGAEKDLHQRVMQDDALYALATCDRLMDTYIPDLIANVCNWHGEEHYRIAVTIAEQYALLAFSSEQDEEEIDRLSNIHFVLNRDSSTIMMLLYGCKALLTLLGGEALNQAAFRNERQLDGFLEKFAENLFKSLWGKLGKHQNNTCYQT